MAPGCLVSVDKTNLVKCVDADPVFPDMGGGSVGGGQVHLLVHLTVLPGQAVRQRHL